jgi:hypothetical protein
MGSPAEILDDPVGDRTGSGSWTMSAAMNRDERSGDRGGPTSVVYVGGCQRSGSTLLDRMVSQLPGYVSAGEVVHVWERGLANDELCGCGESFGRCAFWTEVGAVAFGGWDRVDPASILDLKRRVDRNRYIIFMFAPWLSRRYRRNLTVYVDTLSSLYGAIARVGGGIVVDSSKHPSTAFLLRRVPGIDLSVIHLVRDSRGVGYSLTKKVRRPEVVDREDFMYRVSPIRSAIEWVVFNAAFHVLRWTGTRTRLVRYEDLVIEPVSTLRRCVGRTLDGGDTAFIDGTRIRLGVDHTVAGNPMRFEHGRFELRVDDAWRRSMPRRARRVVTSLTWPLLVRYGYRSRK